jgi:hypothetical protein
MSQLDLSREVDPLRIRESAVLSERDRGRAVEAWMDRMVSEHVSARVFAAILPQAIRVGIPRKHLVALSRMAEQELSHGVLCASVVAGLGGKPVAELPELPDVPAHEDTSPRDALLRNVISTSCLHETIAVALVGAEREQVWPSLRKVFRSILSDEVKHARIGWALLKETEMDAASREGMAEYLVGAFDGLVDHYSPFLSVPAASDDALAAGVPDGASQWRLVLETVDQVILPGLESHGIDARAAWAASAQGRASSLS